MDDTKKWKTKGRQGGRELEKMSEWYDLQSQKKKKYFSIKLIILSWGCLLFQHFVRHFLLKLPSMKRKKLNSNILFNKP